MNLSASDAASKFAGGDSAFRVGVAEAREVNNRPLASGVETYHEAIKGGGKFVLVDG